ncbi:hypothetical protein BJY52DRAFT_1182183 [Lactarius psammicola]|nr:hypothetical protein BJY52DRAFT_1182183 [Lactarius psammicola]
MRDALTRHRNFVPAPVRLHPVLQACVAPALSGMACADNVVDAANSKATLASVLARAQLPRVAIHGESLSFLTAAPDRYMAEAESALEEEEESSGDKNDHEGVATT